MRVLYVTLEDISLQKGSVTHIREVVEGLRRKGHCVTLIGRGGRQDWTSDGFWGIGQSSQTSSTFFRKSGLHYLVAAASLLFRLFQVGRRCQIIYARDFHAASLSGPARRLFGKRLIFEINGAAAEERLMKGADGWNRPLAVLFKWGERLAARQADRIVAVTPGLAELLETDNPGLKEKIRVIPNGVNLSRFRPMEEKAVFVRERKRLGIGPDETVITFVGNLASWQGLDDLVKAAGLLKGRGWKVRFLIVGEGHLRPSIEAAAGRMGLSGCLIFSGMVAHESVPMLLNLSDICLLLKRPLASGFSPLKLYEYLACGKPVVATRVSGLEFVEAEGVGRTVPPGDAEAVAAALEELIRDPAKREAMGRKASSLAKSKFGWEASIDAIDRLLREEGSATRCGKRE